jgi:hypothetical protein
VGLSTKLLSSLEWFATPPNETLFDLPCPVISSGPVAVISYGSFPVGRIDMRKIFSLALFALAITTSVSAWGADNSLGTWKANIAKCKHTPAPWPVKSLTVTREAAPGGVKVTNTGMRTDGSPINAGYTAKYDGSSSEVTGEGSPYDSISVKQEDAETFFTFWLSELTVAQ